MFLSCIRSILCDFGVPHDVLLVAPSLTTLRKMLVDLKREVHKVGLQMHIGKTKILTNQHGRHQNKTLSVEVDQDSVARQGALRAPLGRGDLAQFFPIRGATRHRRSSVASESLNNRVEKM